MSAHHDEELGCTGHSHVVSVDARPSVASELACTTTWTNDRKPKVFSGIPADRPEDARATTAAASASTPRRRRPTDAFFCIVDLHLDQRSELRPRPELRHATPRPRCDALRDRPRPRPVRPVLLPEAHGHRAWPRREMACWSAVTSYGTARPDDPSFKDKSEGKEFNLRGASSTYHRADGRPTSWLLPDRSRADRRRPSGQATSSGSHATSSRKRFKPPASGKDLPACPRGSVFRRSAGGSMDLQEPDETRMSTHVEQRSRGAGLTSSTRPPAIRKKFKVGRSPTPSAKNSLRTRRRSRAFSKPARGS